MNKLAILQKLRNKKSSNSELLDRYSENKLTPVNLTGVVVPWSQVLSDGQASSYKLVCASGLEYYIIADSEWEETLSWYSWDDVNIEGLLNIYNMSLIPQRVHPREPTGHRASIIDFSKLRKLNFVGNVAKTTQSLLIIAAAVITNYFPGIAT